MIKNYPNYKSEEILRIIELLKYPEQIRYCHEDLTKKLIDILEDYATISDTYDELVDHVRYNVEIDEEWDDG